MQKSVLLSICQNKSWGENGQHYCVPENIPLFFGKIIILQKFQNFQKFKNKFLPRPTRPKYKD